jgi:hypothetical protein
MHHTCILIYDIRLIVSKGVLTMGNHIQETWHNNMATGYEKSFFIFFKVHYETKLVLVLTTVLHAFQ